MNESQSIRKRKLPSFEHEARPSIPNYEFPKTKMDISDVFLCTSIEKVQVGSHYDSIFSLVHWIKHCKAIIGLSNKDSNNLFWDVIFHPSFLLENVNIKSIVDLKTYKQQLFKKEDGWNEYVVHVMENDVGKLMYYQDPLQALTTLFSSSQVVFRFHIHPTTPNNSQTYSTPNLTQ